jgi:hypothetical protein
MVGKRIQFDDQTWEAMLAVSQRRGRTTQQLLDEAITDLLKKHNQPVGLMVSLKESVGTQKGRRAKK